MAEIYPDLRESTEEYRSKYRRVAKLHTLGRRTNAMAERFGRGILGLMPHGDQTKSSNMEISDAM
ncbi:hypothetical protein PHISP_04062 [Aspergillus sp. HF37]|uniref:Uncharacterized protein n=1 Tax=Aspergillus sclerotialis TaxID=2070753 RepID=A0A3A2ZHF2_9EURO|nr:hypothetical protein PHISCL_10982 [Aspergillus sclerotialis]RMJ25079.1 hypothetical protein PHISP_04062 [Aspergillus sp. HF37]